MDSTIIQVKFSLYVDQVEKVKLEFINNLTDTRTSWFSVDNLLTADPWTDLKPFVWTAGSFFSTDGWRADGNKEDRRFFVSKRWAGCPNDAGWMMIGETYPQSKCDWARGVVPYILYTPGNVAGTFVGMKKADGMAIFVKTAL